MGALVDIDQDDLFALEEEARERGRQSLLGFTVFTNPAYRVNWHHRLMARKLDDFIAGRLKRLIIAMPPRMGKSEQVSRRMPAYIFGRFPKTKIIATSYTADLAKAMSRDVQRIILSEEFTELFPTVGLNSKHVVATAESWKRTADEFEIVNHGGYYKCAGVGGGITGRGADYLIVDDPIKSREDANSPTKREKLWGWYLDDLKTRLDGNGGILVMATRWHEDDLTGRLLRQMKEDPDADQWEVLEMPGRLDEPGHAEDPRAIGDTLWPWFWAGKRDDLTEGQMEDAAREYLRKLEKGNPYGFASLYQQRPTPKSGNIFKPERIEMVKNAPCKRTKTIRYWDKAGTEGGGKYTAGVKISKLEDGRWIIDHVIRGQWSALNREKVIKDTATLDGQAVTIYIEKEGGSGGKESAENTVRNLAGFVIRTDPPGTNKESRAEPFASQVEGGNVLMIIGDWNYNYKEELRHFPFGTYSDQVDASSGAFNRLEAGGYNIWGLTKD